MRTISRFAFEVVGSYLDLSMRYRWISVGFSEQFILGGIFRKVNRTMFYDFRNTSIIATRYSNDNHNIQRTENYHGKYFVADRWIGTSVKNT